MTTKKNFMFLLWMGIVGALGYAGWNLLTKTGAGMAYDRMVKDLDSGETCIMDKPNGEVIFVRKVNVQDDSADTTS